jgi:hypothetical protein
MEPQNNKERKMKEIYRDKDRMIATDGRRIHVAGRKEMTFGIHGISMTDRHDPKVVAQLKKMGENPTNWYTIRNTANQPMVVLPVATKPAIQTAIQMGKDLDAENNRIANLPENRDRREIENLYDKAYRIEHSGREDNVMAPAQMRSEARRMMAAWREKYPDAAMAEDKRNLRAKAEDMRSKAIGALLYDMDGSLSREAQQQRHDDYIRQAEEIERGAAQ